MEEIDEHRYHYLHVLPHIDKNGDTGTYAKAYELKKALEVFGIISTLHSEPREGSL